MIITIPAVRIGIVILDLWLMTYYESWYQSGYFFIHLKFMCSGVKSKSIEK